jgi:radical SAM protein with 4Fe4S-binding SPASM domain
MTAASRRRLPTVDTDQAFHPRYVVWELTLACDQPCTHCGSRAGTARPNEPGTADALRVAEELADLGAKEVVLIGGEAYLHPGFLEIIAKLSERGAGPVMTTGGRGVTKELAVAMKGAGLTRASVSIDGMETAHDTMRAARGSFASATAALSYMRAAGIRIHANTNLNRWNEPDLEALYEHLRAQKIESWQVQLTSPLGRAADRADMLLQPYDLPTLLPRIARLKERAYTDGILLMPGNNLGYFGPEEGFLRSMTPDGADHFIGCQAGRFVMGIEADGAVKGCPSLQTSHYVGGTLREKPLADIWNDSPELAFKRGQGLRVRSEPEGAEQLWGYCATCTFADTCKGGCTFTAHSFFGKPGNNPYCHYRAEDFQKRGLRERLVLRENAAGLPFDNGLFELIVEPADSPEPPPPEKRERLLQVRRKPRP